MPSGLVKATWRAQIASVTKPGELPDFFRFPAPDGRSRESTLRLDAEGHFWHDGARVEHRALEAALHGWIARHPEDGRFILTNGYDWTYLTVDDAPYVVRSLRVEPDEIWLELSDATSERWAIEGTRVGQDDALYTVVKHDKLRGPWEAKFSRHAQTSLSPLLCPAEGGHVCVRLGGRKVPFPFGASV